MAELRGERQHHERLKWNRYEKTVWTYGNKEKKRNAEDNGGQVFYYPFTLTLNAEVRSKT